MHVQINPERAGGRGVCPANSSFFPGLAFPSMSVSWKWCGFARVISCRCFVKTKKTHVNSKQTKKCTMIVIIIIICWKVNDDPVKSRWILADLLGAQGIIMSREKPGKPLAWGKTNGYKS